MKNTVQSQKAMKTICKTLGVGGILAALLLTNAQAQQLQFCIYNKYGQRQGGCYVDKQSCERVVASYNKSNASMGQFCQPEKKLNFN